MHRLSTKVPAPWFLAISILLVINLFLLAIFLLTKDEITFPGSETAEEEEEPSSCLIKSKTRGLFSDSVPSPRIIVTGGAGFIGSHLVAKLVEIYSTEQVVVIDSLVRGKLENLKEIREYSQLTVCVANLEIPTNAKKYVKGADVVFHLAASVAGVDYVFTHEPEVFRTNILLNENVLDAAITSGAKRYIYAGTACSFPKHLQTSTSEVVLAMDQTYPAEPESSYGWSKLMGEYEAHLAGRSGKIDVGVIRFHNVYGDHTEYEESTSQAIPALIYRALKGGNGKGELAMYGNGEQYRDFLHVSDAVSGLLAFLRLRSPISFHETIQIGSGHGVRILELAEYISEIAFSEFGIQYNNRPLKVLPDLSKPTGDIGRISDNEAAKSLLGWIPKVTWKRGVKMLAHWIDDQMKNRTTLSGGGDFLSLFQASYAFYNISASPDFSAVWYGKPPYFKNFSYYYEIYRAIKEHPAVSLCYSFDRCSHLSQKELVVILPANVMTIGKEIVDAVNSVKKEIEYLDSVNSKKKVIFAVFLNKVYKNLQRKIDLLLPLLEIPESTVLVFSWSPHAIEWSSRIPADKQDRMFFYFLPFGVNLRKFDLRKKKKGDYKYDLYFAGDKKRSKYRDRKQIAAHFPNLTTEYGLQFNDPSKYLPFDEYQTELARSKMCLSTIGMPNQVDLVSTRYFETMLSGTTLVFCGTSPFPEVYKAAGIVDGETVLMFDGVSGFLSKIVNISRSITPSHHPYSRILKKARETALKLHSWKNRASFFLKTVMDHMSSQKPFFERFSFS